MPPVRHMVMAMAVLVVPVLVISWWFTRIPEPPITAVDWQGAASQARAAAVFPVWTPRNLPDSWIAVRARWTPKGEPGIDGRPVVGNTWQLGFLGPDRRYLGVDQRDQAREQLVDKVTRQSSADGSSSVLQREWQRRVSRDGRTRSLVLEDDGSVVVVSGDVPYAQLEAFAATLGTD